MRFALTLFVLAQLADAGTFWWMLQQGGVEGNPIVLYLLGTVGVTGALLAKLGLVLVVLNVAHFYDRTKWRYDAVAILLFGAALGAFGAWTNIQ